MLPPSTELGPAFPSIELGPAHVTPLVLPITIDPGPSVTDVPPIILAGPKIELGPDPVSTDDGPAV